MSSAMVKRIQKSRSSKIFCQEKFACQGDRVEAEYVCEECGTHQCGTCEAKLHEIAKFVFHDRKRIQAPQTESLCQLGCEDRNFADVRCENCALNFCHDCNSKMHNSGKRKLHKRVSLKDIGLNQGLGSVIHIPDSATQTSDDSLTFVSLQNDNYSNDAEIHSSNMSDRSESGRISLPDVAVNSSDLESAMESISLTDDPSGELRADQEFKSFMLVDDQEKLKVDSEEELIQKLGCDPDANIKVVSIFGNTGDGKSHTLNHTFFGGKEVYQTSADQASCTVGVWAAYNPLHNAVIIDTEGLLGVTSNQNQRTRLLLKVLAVSDVVIYRTKADRLHNDLFHFLGDASKAYMKHFSEELRAAWKRCHMESHVSLSNLGPSVIIFHETVHTEVLGEGKGRPVLSAEDQLKKRFCELDITIDAFSSLIYVGTRTVAPPTDFSRLLKAVKTQLQNTSVRSPRHPGVMFKAIQVLNEKFSGAIEKSIPSTFPDQYFTCTNKCLSCGVRCSRTMNHVRDDIAHHSDTRCQYQHQFDNKIFTCKACYERGIEVIVVPKTSSSSDSSWYGLVKYAWSGYVLECQNCGIIFRSREYWYGNCDPVSKTVVRTEIRHVWPGGNPVLQGTHNAGRRLMDGLHYMSDRVADISSKPTKVLTSWVADRIAPHYWVPNSLITHCTECNHEFGDTETKHHCRACGQGFCDDCSQKKRPVPERGWGPDPVRVCDHCYENKGIPESSRTDEGEIRARVVGETVTNTLGVMVSALDYPLDMLKDTTRPAYWVPDQDIKNCCVCKVLFTIKLSKHHCRACGQGVCDDCSPDKVAVPSRGWDHPVRVCRNCSRKKDTL